MYRKCHAWGWPGWDKKRTLGDKASSSELGVAEKEGRR